jgi:hypothetical protein
MSVRRRSAELACRILQRTLPPQLQPWGWAVRHEIDDIADDTEALLFVLDGVRGFAPRILAFHLLRAFAPARNDALSSGGTIDMGFYDNAVLRPRALGIACAVAAALLGLAYMAAAGAPMRYLGINSGALIAGLVLLVLVGRVMPEARRWPGAITLTLAILLLITALLANPVEGATRWVRVGALFLQPSLILLPVMIVGFARSRNALSTVGMVVTAAALAIQPDRAMAGMLAAGMTALAVLRPDRLVLTAFVGSIGGFGVTLFRADTLPAVQYVDQILYSAFDVHVFAGLAVLGGSILLIVPAIVGLFNDADRREAYWAFGIAWLAAIVAAALGNYPTPIVGYGGSAVLGYVLSLTVLPKRAGSRLGAEGPHCEEADDGRPSHLQLRVGLSYSA